MTTQDHLGVKLQEAYLSLKVKKNLLRAQEECKRALGQLDAARAQVDLLKHYLNNARRERDEVKAKLDDAQKELHNQKKITEMRKAEADRLDSATIATYGTLYGEVSHLRAELKIEREAHNKLKALCNERGFGTPLFYTTPILPKPQPTWTVSFYQKNIHLGDITYTSAPSAKTLNDIQESLKATSWKLIYRG